MAAFCIYCTKPIEHGRACSYDCAIFSMRAEAISLAHDAVLREDRDPPHVVRQEAERWASALLPNGDLFELRNLVTEYAIAYGCTLADNDYGIENDAYRE